MGIDTSYLMHYGVRGQKHGRRRYQNEDGSYTEEGRIHYGIGDKMRNADSREVYSGHVGENGNLNKAGMHHIKLMEDMKQDAKTRKARYGMQALVANGGAAVSALTMAGGLTMAAAPILAKVSPRARQIVHDLGISVTGDSGKKLVVGGLALAGAGATGLAKALPAATEINTTYRRARLDYKKSNKSLKAYNNVLKGYNNEQH